MIVYIFRDVGAGFKGLLRTHLLAKKKKRITYIENKKKNSVSPYDTYFMWIIDLFTTDYETSINLPLKSVPYFIAILQLNCLKLGEELTMIVLNTAY